MSRPGAPQHHPTNFVRRLTAALAADARVEGLWLEGEDAAIQWPPYAHLDLHLAVPENHLAAFRLAFVELVQTIDEITDLSQQEAPLKGFAGTGTLSDGTFFTYRLERTSQIAKVPRHALNVLLDRSGGLLIPALSFVPR